MTDIILLEIKLQTQLLSPILEVFILIIDLHRCWTV